MKRALITGITGQDGSYLAELLLSKGYQVHGLVRRTSQPSYQNIEGILDRLTLYTGDLTDGVSVTRIVAQVQPHEVYNLGAMSQVRDSYDHPEVTQDINVGGLLRILEACRRYMPDARIYQASSSEIYGRVVQTPQTEHTPLWPRSPYGVAKAAAHYMARVYREGYGMHVSCGILFNHESPRRGETFVTRKIAKGVAEIASGRRKTITLGNLDAKRDWGFAKEYVEAMWLMLQQERPDDYVIATGEMHTVGEFARAAFQRAGIADWKRHVEFDENLTRPAEVDLLCGNGNKAKTVLGFEPKVRFGDLVNLMTDVELANFKGRAAA